MNLPTVLGCILLAAGLLSACAGRAEPPPAPAGHGWRQPWQSDKPLPKWIADPTESGSRIAAYGSATYRSSESRSEQRDRAMANARDELNRMLRLRIRNAVRDYVAESRSGVTSFSDSVSKQISEGTVSGTYQRDEWQNEKTLELYVWVAVDPAVATTLAQSVVQAAASAAPSDPTAAHLRAKAESDKGFAELDKLLDKSFSQGGR
jgi:hypothetical protein